MLLLKRLAVVAFMPLWLAGELVCLALTLTGIGYVLTGEFDKLFRWWDDILSAVCERGNRRN